MKSKKYQIVVLSVAATIGAGWLGVVNHFDKLQAAEMATEQHNIAMRVTPDQRDLETLWRDGYSRYKSAPNEIQQSAVFVDVSRKTDALMKENGAGMIGWYVRVSDISTDHGGETVSVQFSSADGREAYGDNTDYSKGSDVYKALTNLKVGSYVQLSAKFVPTENTEGGVIKWEDSPTEEGSFKRSDFNVRVEEIRPTNPPLLSVPSDS